MYRERRWEHGEQKGQAGFNLSQEFSRMLSQTYFQGDDVAPPGRPRFGSQRTEETRARHVHTPRLLAYVDDTSSARSVVAHATAIARSLGLETEIARVIEDSQFSGMPIDPIEWKLRTQEHRERLKDLTAAIGTDRKAKGVLLHGHPSEELLDWSNANGGTLLALGTQSGQKKYGLGSTALRILEQGAASLLLIPETAGDSASYKRILVPIDGSSRADSVIPIARRIARRIARGEGTELILAHVLPKPARQTGFRHPGTVDLHARIERENATRAREHLEQLRIRSSEPGVKVRSVILEPADPRHATCEFAASNSVDLVVMSSHGATALNDVPCGSVAEYLASHCTMPVLMIRPNLAANFGSSTFGADGQLAFRFG